MKPSKKSGLPGKTLIHNKYIKKSGSDKLLVPVGVAIIVVLAAVVFSPSLSANFLGWDDYKYIRENPLIRTLSWEGIVQVFNLKTYVAGNYHPLTVLTNMIEYRIAGLHPFLYHFNNLILHIFNIMLVARLIWMMTKKNYFTLIVTLLFAIHPMRVESVVWAAERKDVLYAFFFLLAMVSYAYNLLIDRNKRLFYLLSVLFFTLSLLSKGQAVVLPLTLLLLDYWFSGKVTLKSVLNKLPFFLLSIAFGILAIMAQHSSLTSQRLTEQSFIGRIAIAAFSIPAYFYKLIYPFELSSFYKYPPESEMWQIYLGALLSVAMVVTTYIFFRKNRAVVFGSLFFLFTISIVSQILPVGNAIIADRYTYIPYFGLFFIAGMLLDPLFSGKKRHLMVTVAISIMISGALLIKTYTQAAVWKNDKTLWENAIHHDPDNGLAYCNLGACYIEEENFPVAVSLLEKAILYEQNFAERNIAYLNMGVALSRTGRDQEAIRFFNKALELNPGMENALFGRGLSYTAVGDYDAAAADFSVIIMNIDSLNARVYYSRGIANNKAKRVSEALADYTSAIRINPGFASPYVNRGNIYFSLNRLGEALEDYKTALKLEPDNGKTWLNRSAVYFRLQKFPEALQDALMARDLKAGTDENYIRDLQVLVKRKG